MIRLDTDTQTARASDKVFALLLGLFLKWPFEDNSSISIVRHEKDMKVIKFVVRFCHRKTNSAKCAGIPPAQVDLSRPLEITCITTCRGDWSRCQGQAGLQVRPTNCRAIYIVGTCQMPLFQHMRIMFLNKCQNTCRMSLIAGCQKMVLTGATGADVNASKDGGFAT